MDSSLFEAEFSLYFPSSLTWSHPEAPRPFLLRVEEVRALLHTSRLLLLLLLLLPPPPWGQSRSGAPSNPSSLLEEVLLLLRGSAMVLSAQALGLVVLAAILLQTIAVAVSFMYFSRVLNTVSRWFERRRRARASPWRCVKPHQHSFNLLRSREEHRGGAKGTGTNLCRKDLTVKNRHKRTTAVAQRLPVWEEIEWRSPCRTDSYQRKRKHFTLLEEVPLLKVPLFTRRKLENVRMQVVLTYYWLRHKQTPPPSFTPVTF